MRVPASQHAVAATADNKFMFIFGGYDGGKVLNDLWLLELASMQVRQLEVWAVEDDPPVDEDEGRDDPLTAAGVLAPKHAETRAFLEMAGKSLPSQQAAKGGE